MLKMFTGTPLSTGIVASNHGKAQMQLTQLINGADTTGSRTTERKHKICCELGQILIRWLASMPSTFTHTRKKTFYNAETVKIETFFILRMQKQN